MDVGRKRVLAGVLLLAGTSLRVSPAPARDGSALPPTLHVHASRHAAYHRMRVSQGYLPLEPSRGSTHNFWTRAGKGTSARRGA